MLIQKQATQVQELPFIIIECQPERLYTTGETRKCYPLNNGCASWKCLETGHLYYKKKIKDKYYFVKYI